MSQKFCNILVVCQVQFGNSGHFCRDYEDDEVYWTVRYQTQVLFTEFATGPEYCLRIHGFSLPDLA